MSDTFSDDYQTVAERIKIFREKYPEGSLRPADVSHPFRVVAAGDRIYIAVTAAAYRTPDDPAPGIGQAWEPIPGQTQYSRDSELMIAETSAWGRAIIAALAADSRKIATRDEVTAAENRRTAPQPAQPQVQQPVVQQPVSPPVAPTPAPVQQSVASPIPEGMTLPDALQIFRSGQPMPQQSQVPQQRPVAQQGITPQQAPETHDPAKDSDNLSFVDSIMLHIIKNPASTKEELREAWLALSQANMSHWRVEPFGGMDPDGDGKVAISELLTYVANTKN
jgi:hypothetical protein